VNFLLLELFKLLLILEKYPIVAEVYFTHSLLILFLCKLLVKKHILLIAKVDSAETVGAILAVGEEIAVDARFAERAEKTLIQFDAPEAFIANLGTKHRIAVYAVPIVDATVKVVKVFPLHCVEREEAILKAD
jgi:hypothetical protein